MKTNLSQPLRILVASIYVVLLIVIFHYLGGDVRRLVWSNSIDSSIWFYAGAFMIILGSYIVEPYFTKPSDAIANSTAVLIALLGLSNKNGFFAYSFVFYYAIAILLLSILAIFLKDRKHAFWQVEGKIAYWVVETFGKSNVIFSIVYLSASYSYFAIEGKIIPFICVIAFWVCLTFFDVASIIVDNISRLFRYLKMHSSFELGEAIGCDNPLLYNIEIDYSKHKPHKISYGDLVAVETSHNIGSIGIVINTKQLINKKWVGIYLLQDDDNEIIKMSLNNKKLTIDAKTIFSSSNHAYLLGIDEMDEVLRRKIKKSQLFGNRDQFVGYVTSGSNISTINFCVIMGLPERIAKISEGVVLKTKIYDNETLYQVINGNTKEEHLEDHNRYGYTIGIARKLGKYDYQEKELTTCKWMPAIYSPIFFAFPNTVSADNVKSIANSSIGRLPETELEIPIKDCDSMVTHNTAILGILGIGKSCLAFEIIKKLSDKAVKIICIDITNQYSKTLGEYVDNKHILGGVSSINDVLDKVTPEVKDSKEEGGNLEELKNLLIADFGAFMDNQGKKIRIINPDEIHAIKQDEHAKNRQNKDKQWEMYAPFCELTIAEKTRLISEMAFNVCKQKGITDTARLLLVYEEAHSLIPEWNSVANEGDKSATNGTAKVILQGRKYGMGSLVITQRTANVSKSILNQCNTIFALRVFDDTGKGFLENYIGEDYADTLPTLDERHAIAIGKGLKLKQPVIIQLNDKDNIVIK